MPDIPQRAEEVGDPILIPGKQQVSYSMLINGDRDIIPDIKGSQRQSQTNEDRKGEVTK